MSRIRLIMLALLAVFAVGAVASASASATCYKVAEAGTGNRDGTGTCAVNTGASANEYINVSKLETKLKNGEYCAKVTEAETGNYEDNACTKKVAKKEFIKVLVPEFIHCIKTTAKEDEYPTKAACVKEEKKGEEPREWDRIPVAAGSKITFTSTSEPSYLFANASGTFRIRCGTDTDKGEITSATTVGGVTVNFKECRGFKGTEECPVKSVGAAGAEEIVTKVLSGGLGPVVAAEAPSSEVGLDLKPTTGTTFVELVGNPTTCVPETKVEGSVIGEVEPVNTMDTTGEVIYGVRGGIGKKNKQTIQKFVGEGKDTLTAFAVESGFESEDSLVFSEPIEVGAGPPPPPAPKIELINFVKNTEVVIDHTKSANHEEIRKLVAEGKKPEKAKTIEEVEGADKIEWKAPSGGAVKKNWPLSYAQGGTVAINETRIALEVATQNYLKKEGAGATIIGETTIEGKAVKFEQTLTEAQIKEQLEGVGAHPAYLQFTGEVNVVTLLKEVRSEQPVITWKWKVKQKAGGELEQGAGTSTHNLYATYATPLKATFYTLLAESTEQIEKEAKKEPTKPQMVAGIWKAFSGLPGIHVWIYNPASATGEIKQTVDELEYYEEMPTNESLKKVREKEGMALAIGKFEAVNLLEYLDGECGSWQQAMVQMFEGQGVEATSIKLVTKFKANGAKICEVAEACEMLVKNWKFTKEGIINTEEEVEKLEGIPGESVKTPSSAFANHQVVEIERKIYDPSYGTGPIEGTKGESKRSFENFPESEEIRLEYQNKAIAGYCSAGKCGKEALLALEFKKVAGPVRAVKVGVVKKVADAVPAVKMGACGLVGTGSVWEPMATGKERCLAG
jgi:hypothetical protein